MQELGSKCKFCVIEVRVSTERTVDLLLYPRGRDLRCPPGRSPAWGTQTPPSGFRYTLGQGPPHLTRLEPRRRRGGRPCYPRRRDQGRYGGVGPYCNIEKY